MNQQGIEALAAKYNIDADALQSTFEDCKALIDARLKDKHDDCRQAHVATLLIASYLSQQVEHMGGLDFFARLQMVVIGNDVAELAFAPFPTQEPN